MRRILFRSVVVVWLIVAAYSGLMLLAFYGDSKNGERALQAKIAASGVTLDSLRSVKDPWAEYIRGAKITPKRRNLLEMAMGVQSKIEDPLYWPKQFGQWLLCLVLLPAGVLAAVRWSLERQSSRRRDEAKP